MPVKHQGLLLMVFGLETLLSLCCPRSRLFPLPPSRTWLLPSSLKRGRHLGDLPMGWQEVKEQLRAAVVMLQSLVLPWGFIGAKRGGEKKGSGHSVAGHACFFRKNNHSNNSLRSCTYSWGRKLPKVGTGDKQRVSNCTVFSSLLTHPIPSPKSLVSCVWVGLLGWCVVFFCLSDEGCSAR